MSYKDDDAVAREVTGGPYGDGCAFLLMPFAIVIGIITCDCCFDIILRSRTIKYELASSQSNMYRIHTSNLQEKTWIHCTDRRLYYLYNNNVTN
jgi:hypothetical protein